MSTPGSGEYDVEYGPCHCNADDCPDCGTACTWCGGDGIGDGCNDPLQCCGIDFCHPCRGSGLRSQQTVF